MEFRVLNYFLTVVREKSITNAAKALHISQPALSKQLKQLEEELGVILFERGNREIQLTEEGHYLTKRGKEILQLMESTTLNLTADETISGELAIGGGETNAMQVIAKTLHLLLEKHPDIHIRLYSGNADDVSEKIEKGLLDFGLVIDPVEKQKYMYQKLSQTNHWGLLMRRDHPLARKKSIEPADLQNLPLFTSQQSLMDNRMAEWLGESLANYHLVGSYNLLYNASLMVKEGLGCALCIDGIIHTEGTDLAFVPLYPKLTAGLNIIWKKDQAQSKAAAAFLQLLHTEE